MIIYPAIDLINGKVVRLSRGHYDQKTEYSNDPASIAKQFASSGAEYIHVVDLDGAKAKRPVNLEYVKAIAKASKLPIQIGGGIRSIGVVDELLRYTSRVIIGTVSIRNPDLLRKLIDKFGSQKIIVSIDYKDRYVAINGWLEKSTINTEELKNRLFKAGLKTVVVTDIAKDGLLVGPNIELMQEWKKAGFEVICAGGVTTGKDVEGLKLAGIDGAIIGKALYEGRIKLEDAINAGK